MEFGIDIHIHYRYDANGTMVDHEVQRIEDGETVASFMYRVNACEEVTGDGDEA